jgi:hypothetical protein
LNNVHTVSDGRALLDLHCLTTYDAVQQIDEGALVVVGIVLALTHFFRLQPEIDQAAEAVLINPKVPASEIFASRNRQRLAAHTQRLKR